MQTSRITGTASKAARTATEQPAPTHHYILTLQAPVPGRGVHVSTFSAAITPPDGWTRAELYKALYTQLTTEHRMAGADTLFFSLEPNQL